MISSNRGRGASAATAPARRPAVGQMTGTPGVRGALLSRASFGPTSADRERLWQLGHIAWLDEQLAPDAIDDTQLEQRLAADYPWMGQGAHDLLATFGGGGWRLSEESRAVRLLRALHSKRQLFERIVELWNDHFNVPFGAQDANYLRPVHEEEVIRRHGMGTFPELLVAVATSPAMGAFLDQDSNEAGAPNENYARELLELHTLGVDGGYSELDVREVARCFTGWGYVRHWQSGTFGEFRFDGALHDAGPKNVMGLAIPAGGGEQDGHQILQWLAHHPATARRVSAKLIGWFLGPEAAAGQVSYQGRSVLDRTVDVYTATGGDVPAMVRTILSPEALGAALPWRRRKLKQPFHYAVSLLRALGVEVTAPSTAIYAIEGLGQMPFAWPEPDGYSDAPETWSGGVLPRWRFASHLLNGWTSWGRVQAGDLSALIQGAPPSQWGRWIDHVLRAGELDAEDVGHVQAFVDGAASPGPADLVGAFELAASSPSFQTY